ncbi:hypothetical protein [Aquamicrobium soli]|uniref:Uncharacterized protein n=1 Tax=Aquamicrobium soli TaxID=1811518 RepID=A0ABV7KCS3_9HYPH
MLNILKRAAGFGEPDLIPDDEFASAMDAFPVQPEPTILDRSATVVSTFLDGARSRRADLMTQIAGLTEELRQTDLAIEAFEPVLLKLDDGYDPAADARNEVVPHPKRRQSKPMLAAAE